MTMIQHFWARFIFEQMSLLHKLLRPFVEYLWYYISFKCLLFLLLTQNITETENQSPGSHEFLAMAPNIMSDMRPVEGENEIVCELLEYGAEKLIVSQFK